MHRLHLCNPRLPKPTDFFYLQPMHSTTCESWLFWSSLSLSWSLWCSMGQHHQWARIQQAARAEPQLWAADSMQKGELDAWCIKPTHPWQQTISVLDCCNYLAKLQYFTNLDFPEIRGPIPLLNPPFGGNRSCEVAISCWFINFIHNFYCCLIAWW